MQQLGHELNVAHEVQDNGDPIMHAGLVEPASGHLMTQDSAAVPHSRALLVALAGAKVMAGPGIPMVSPECWRCQGCCCFTLPTANRLVDQSLSGSGNRGGRAKCFFACSDFCSKPPPGCRLSSPCTTYLF